MSWNLVALADAVPSPWRNGGGVTRQLLAWPGGEDWRVRISVADIAADGPFSRFPGIERWFAVLEGAGVDLRVGSQGQRLDPRSAPLRFDGAEDADCRLVAGPTRDFNLMAQPGRARLLRTAGHTRWQASEGALVALYGHACLATLREGDGPIIQVPPATLAWRVLPHASQGEVEGDDLLWMEVLP